MASRTCGCTAGALCFSIPEYPVLTRAARASCRGAGISAPDFTSWPCRKAEVPARRLGRLSASCCAAGPERHKRGVSLADGHDGNSTGRRTRPGFSLRRDSQGPPQLLQRQGRVARHGSAGRLYLLQQGAFRVAIWSQGVKSRCRNWFVRWTWAMCAAKSRP